MPPRFPHDIRRTVLRDMFRSFGLHLSDYHTLWSAVPGKFDFAARRLNSPTTPHFPEGIRFELCRFHSPLLTASRLISFPAPTEMFQFGAFPIMTDHYGEVPFGNPGFIGSMHLPRAYRSLARPSSALEPSHPPDSIIPNYLTRSSKRPVYSTYTRLHMPAVPRRLSILPRKTTFRVHKNGLAGTRTQGLCLAKAAIFQLIYKPERDKRSKWISGLRICSVYRHLSDSVFYA